MWNEYIHGRFSEIAESHYIFSEHGQLNIYIGKDKHINWSVASISSRNFMIYQLKKLRELSNLNMIMSPRQYHNFILYAQLICGEEGIELHDIMNDDYYKL
jgi:hypothetical protein